MSVGTPTSLATVSQGSGRTTTTGAFTPTANAIIWVHFHGRDTAAPSIPTISDSAGLTWTAVFAGQFNSSNRNWIGWAVAPASPSSMTVTADWGASITTSCGQAFETTGADATTPVLVGTTLSAAGSSTTPAPGTVPAITAGNVQLLFISTRAGASIAEGGGAWTELYDIDGTGLSCQTACYYSTTGDTSPTATISSAPWRASALEVAAGVTAASKSDSDTGTLTESGAVVATGTVVADADSGTLAEAGTVAATVVDTDTGAATSGGGVESTTGIDSFVLAEESTSLLIAETGPDGTLAEAYALGAALAVSDAATLTEAGAVVVGALAVAASDTGTLDEASSLSSTFPGIVVDTSGADAGTLAEAAYVAYPVANGADSATLAEAASVAVGQSTTPSDSDTGALQESTDQPAVLTVADTGLVTESGSVVVTVVADESATVDDILAALLADPFQATDTGALTEAAVAADETLRGVVRGSVAFTPRLPGSIIAVPRMAGTVTLTP